MNSILTLRRLAWTFPRFFVIVSSIVLAFVWATSFSGQGRLLGALILALLIGYGVGYYRVRSQRDLIREAVWCLPFYFYLIGFYSSLSEQWAVHSPVTNPSDVFVGVLFGFPAVVLTLLAGRSAGVAADKKP